MTKQVSVLLVLFLIFGGCHQANHEQMDDVVEQQIASNTPLSSFAAVENEQDSTRKFIRTADIKCKVKDVIQATYGIEDAIRRNDGFVAFTDLKSEIDEVNTIPISEDSLLESTHFTVTNTMTLRIPNERLDASLKEIAQYVDYLDYRVIKAEDVALQILSNQLAQKRMEKNEGRLADAIQNQGKKLEETAKVENAVLNAQEKADQNKISNLSLADQVNYSTVHLAVYQRQTIKREIIVNQQNITIYEPNLAAKIWDSFLVGWNILEAFLVWIVKLWALILLGIIVFVFYKKYAFKLKS